MTKKEYNELCDNCEFIRESMQFYSKEDFINKKEYIKMLYDDLDAVGKQIYMYYVFSKRYIRYKEVCRMWDYLNNYTDYIA